MRYCNLVVYDADDTGRIERQMIDAAKLHEIELKLSWCASEKDVREALQQKSDLTLILAHGSRNSARLSRGPGPLMSLTWADVLRGITVDTRALVTLICGQNMRSHWRDALRVGTTLATTNWKLENGGIVPAANSLFRHKDLSAEGVASAFNAVHTDGPTEVARRTLRPSNWTISSL